MCKSERTQTEEESCTTHFIPSQKAGKKSSVPSEVRMVVSLWKVVVYNSDWKGTQGVGGLLKYFYSCSFPVIK